MAFEPDMASEAPGAAGPSLDPFEPGYFEDPYAQYAVIRAAEPVHRTLFGPWLLTRWAEVHQLLREPGTSVEDRNATSDFMPRAQLMDLGERAERGSKAILNIDPPDHTRLRKLVSKAFTPRTVERLRPHVESLVDGLLDEIAQRGRDGPVDLIASLAFPLPFAVISEMLGMPDSQNVDQLREWSHTLTQVLDPILAMTNSEAIFEASDHMTEVVTEVIEWKRSRLDIDDDLLTALLRAEDGGDVLSEQELIDNVMLLYLAGHETTVNLIGNGTNALLRNRPQLERLVEDPGLDANAIEELLRYDSPVQFSRRIMLKPIEVGGQQIEAGEFVMTGLGAANHDPAKFGPDAEQLRLDRQDAKEHVSFGNGVHHCLGAALARLEGNVAMGRLVRRFPNIEPADETPAWNGRMILRGLDHLPINLA